MEERISASRATGAPTAERMDAIVITSSATRDGVCVLETPCADYEEYRTLPRVVYITLYGRSIFGLTGWNSDHGVAYYRDDATVAHS